MLEESKEEGVKVTLIDFNAAKKFTDANTKNKVLMYSNSGYPSFAAPEIHLSQSYE